MSADARYFDGSAAPAIASLVAQDGYLLRDAPTTGGARAATMCHFATTVLIFFVISTSVVVSFICFY